MQFVSFIDRSMQLCPRYQHKNLNQLWNNQIWAGFLEYFLDVWHFAAKPHFHENQLFKTQHCRATTSELLLSIVKYLKNPTPSFIFCRDLDQTSNVVIWLWDILESLSPEEKVLFMVFISGRSRLPVKTVDLPQRFQVLRVDKPVDGMPTAQTCFFQLRLPPYSSKEIMMARIKYAIRNCRWDNNNSTTTRDGLFRTFRSVLSSCISLIYDGTCPQT